MTFKQKILKGVYPLLMKLNKLMGTHSKVLEYKKKSIPPQSFFELGFLLNNDTVISFSQYKGKKILLVNTASDCGYTKQYADLEKLFNNYKGKLIVIGFPANDFGQQEKGTDEEIAQFCKINYGVTFGLAKKSVVINSPDQNPVFQWLTDPAKNGWCSQQPTWNFSKYLVNEAGMLTHYFDPSLHPTGDRIRIAIEQ
jgi:glutathione peroxidase